MTLSSSRLFGTDSFICMSYVPFLSLSETLKFLMDALKVLADRKINMKKLESRPIQGKPWEYLFFLEIQLPEDGSFEELCSEMKNACATFRVLGTYASVL